SARISSASGCIGLSQYAACFWPRLDHVYASHQLSLGLPPLGRLQLDWLVSAGACVAIAGCLVAIFLLYRRITSIGALSKLMWMVVVGPMAWIILSGLAHFNRARAFDFPPGTLHFSRPFFRGMGSSMLYAAYLYWGYYNVCFFGGEVKKPGKTIPRALLLSILLVACLYIVMNISVLCVIPWRELDQAAKSNRG